VPPELLLPATDAGAIGQMVGAVVLTAAAAVLLRNHKDLRFLAVGIGVALFSLMALRTLH
jgi:hypothetical protein